MNKNAIRLSMCRLYRTSGTKRIALDKFTDMDTKKKNEALENLIADTGKEETQCFVQVM